jgi:quercetin dioxygenase-like cupin family protein
MLHSDSTGNTIEGLAQFDLTKEIADCEQTKPWKSGLFSRTLYKKPDFRTVLIVMEPSARMKEHHADGTLSIHVLKGRIRMGIGEQHYELPAGNLLTLEASVKHDVEAVEDSAFLLTISWPSDQELLAKQHRGYGS